MFLGLQWYWRLVTVAVLIISIPFKVKFMKWWSKRQSCQILFPVFGGEMATAKIQTVKGLRVGDFFAHFAKKYYSSFDGLDSRNGRRTRIVFYN